jgi:CheY-like chemotaxis protein
LNPQLDSYTPITNYFEEEMKMVRILFIDDEILYHKMISKTLEPLGYHVDTASSGKEGMKKVSEIHPDLIITDVMMPDMSGYDITRTLRRDARFSYIPIMVLTA